MSVILQRTGSMNWIAKASKDSEQKFEGKNPEAAIKLLFEAMPEFAGHDIRYIPFEGKFGRKAITAVLDLAKCPVCEKPVVYARVRKPNGRIGVSVFHEGEVPTDAEMNPNVSDEYKRWLLKTFHKAPVQYLSDEVDNDRTDDTLDDGPVETTENVMANTSQDTQNQGMTATSMLPVLPQSPIVPIKPKVVIPARTGNPDLPADRPVVDITGMKHNKFAIVGHIVKTLREKHPDKIDSIRADLVNNSHDMPELFRTAEQYAVIHENGLPVHMESGL